MQTCICIQGVGMFMDCPPIVCRQIIWMLTVPVVCWLGWKTADRVCKSGHILYSRVHSCFLQCLFVAFELLTCDWMKQFFPLLKICSPLRVHCANYKNYNKKLMRLIFLQKILNQYYWSWKISPFSKVSSKEGTEKF